MHWWLCVCACALLVLMMRKLCGAAGCGKSTQVPQYILEQAVAAGQGAGCSCVCTQPRRISAVGVSTRVAQVPPFPCGKLLLQPFIGLPSIV